MGAKIWSFASGKGGVGKTFATASFGLTLSKLNHRVLLVDFDLSGANLHTHLGLSLTTKNIRRFFNGEAPLQELILNTKYPKLDYIQGIWDMWSITDFFSAQTRKLMKSLRQLDYDYILIDLGSGAGAPILEAFDSSDERILMVNSEPTAIEKTYRFMETYMCYALGGELGGDLGVAGSGSVLSSPTPPRGKTLSPDGGTLGPHQVGGSGSIENEVVSLQGLLREFRQLREGGGEYSSFRQFLKKKKSFNIDFFENLLRSPVRLIVNFSRSRLDQDLGFSIKSVFQKYYEIHIEHLGFIDFDNAVSYSVRDKEPVLIEKPFTPLAGQFLNMCRQITSHNFQSNLLKDVV